MVLHPRWGARIAGDAMTEAALDRRQFLVTASVVAGGMALSLSTARAATWLTAAGPWSPDAAKANELSAWIEIAPDDTVTLHVPTPEIGNGAMTQVAMNVTEELGCAWSRVKAEFCSLNRNYIDNDVYAAGDRLSFFGGHSTDKQHMKLAMQMGASARERLKAAAAARWKVPASAVEAKDSVLTHRASGRKLRYGEVAAEAAKLTLAAEPALKPQSEWTFIGKASPGKLHLSEIVTGKAIFGIDVTVPGMVHAALMQAPVHGGKLKSHSPAAVLAMPGVRAVVVIDPAKTRGAPVPQKSTFGFGDSLAQSGVAVIADHYWQAKMALQALPVEWDNGPGVQWESERQIAAAAVAQIDKGQGRVQRKAGDVAAATGKRMVAGTYSTPYADNAQLEPLNGTALVTADSVEVWCPTQDLRQAYWVAIDETGVAPEKVKLHPTYVGGGFGRRTQADDVRMVVAVAKEYPGVPVKVIWSREECFRQGRYRTPITTRFKAVLDDVTGLPQTVVAEACYSGTRPAFQLPLGYFDQPYFNSGIIPNVQLAASNVPVHILNGAYRGPCYNSHAFLVETFVDECAVAAGVDPLEYRLKLLRSWDQAWNECLRIASKKAGWGRPLARGEGMGVAISGWPVLGMRQTGTVVCAVARVTVSRAGAINVKQVDVAFDCGRD